ncbi:MAG: GNAT family N-acetyltransferase [Anaerolineales bacterium]|nr:GNAT family N-acetyltransferase [Anaerolineales bacterium]
MSDLPGDVQPDDTEMVQLREFRYPEDYPTVIELWSKAGPGIHVRRSDQPEEIVKKLQRDPDLFLLAEVDQQVIGSVMGAFDGRRGMIYHLAVAEPWCQKGVGEALMSAVEQRLRLKGCIRCYLMVTADNQTAIRFYEKRGWERMDPILTLAKDLK